MGKIVLIRSGRNAFTIGFPYIVVIIGLPQRFQVVNGDTPILAGIHSLLMLLASAVGAAAGGVAMSKKNVCFYLVLLADTLQAIGTGLLSSIPTSAHVLPRTYGFVVVQGSGMGMSIAALMFIARVELKPHHQGHTRLSRLWPQNLK